MKQLSAKDRAVEMVKKYTQFLPTADYHVLQDSAVDCAIETCSRCIEINEYYLKTFRVPNGLAETRIKYWQSVIRVLKGMKRVVTPFG